MFDIFHQSFLGGKPNALRSVSSFFLPLVLFSIGAVKRALLDSSCSLFSSTKALLSVSLYCLRNSSKPVTVPSLTSGFLPLSSLKNAFFADSDVNFRSLKAVSFHIFKNRSYDGCSVCQCFIFIGCLFPLL